MSSKTLSANARFKKFDGGGYQLEQDEAKYYVRLHGRPGGNPSHLIFKPQLEQFD
jgi:hypothetical protein